MPRLLILLTSGVLGYGCAIVEQRYPGPERPDGEVAKIRTKHYLTLTDWEREVVSLSRINGKHVEADDRKSVAVLPGTHAMEVNYFRRLGPPENPTPSSSGDPGMDLAIKALHRYGEERNRALVVEEHSAIHPPAEVTFRLEAGRTYYLTAEKDVRVRFDGREQDDGWFPLVTVQGSDPLGRGATQVWRPKLVCKE